MTNEMPLKAVWSEIAEEVAGIGFWRMDFATGVVDWSPNMFRLFEFPFGPAPNAEQTMSLIFLGTVALVVRSGIFARQNPGRPINSAMREALNANQPQLTGADQLLIEQTYGSARKTPSGLRYVVRAQGTGDATPVLGSEIIAHYDGRLLDGTPFDSSYKRGVPFTFRVGAGAVMFVVAWAVERFVLRKLVNQEGATLLMVTLGIAYVLEGLGQTFFGSEIYSIDVGMPKDPVIMFEGLFEGGVLINKEDFIAAALAAVLVAGLTVFFQKTAIGRALRAVADDHQAAQSVGIPLNKTWVIVWCVAGLVALVAGIIWGSKMGVQFSLVTVALRALPVVILGGLCSSTLLDIVVTPAVFFRFGRSSAMQLAADHRDPADTSRSRAVA